jgi:hypothetical protein
MSELETLIDSLASTLRLVAFDKSRRWAFLETPIGNGVGDRPEGPTWAL